jgi:pimeloyl-ACP methyl ester carboxylesterase
MLVDVDGRRLHLLVQGEDRGRPTVILDGGMVSFSSNWAWVQPAVAETTRVVAVDRAGLGWSDPGPRPRDAGASAEELHAALAVAGVPGPYVMVGHSYGGLTSLAFATMFRDEVAGVVLVDGSHPDQWAEFGMSGAVVGVGTAVSSVLARFGVFQVFDREYQLLCAGLPERQRAELEAFASTPRALATASAAGMAWDSVSRPLVDGAGGLADLPLAVLSVTDQPRKSEELIRLQDRLTRWSSNSRHIIVEGAYHEGLISQQKYAEHVVGAVLELAMAPR